MLLESTGRAVSYPLEDKSKDSSWQCLYVSVCYNGILHAAVLIVQYIQTACSTRDGSLAVSAGVHS